MTVSAQTNNALFTGNGATTVFPLPFRFFSNAHIFAYFIDPVTGASTPMTLGADYTLAGAGEPEVDGNSLSVLTTTVPLANLRGMYVERVMPQTQETDIVNQGEFFASTHEDVFDRLTMLNQQAENSSNGAIRVAIGDPTPNRLPPAASRALQLMGFDSFGNPVPVIPASGSASDLALNLLNAIDPAKGAAMIGYDGGLLYTALQGNGWINSLDPTGAQDCTAAIQAALNARDVVVLPAGDFKISAKISLKSGNILVGQGYGATRIFRETAVPNFDFFEGISVSGVAIRNIWFDAVQSEIVTVGANRRSAIRFWDNATTVRCDSVSVVGCKFTKFTAAEIQAEGIRGVVTFEETNGFYVSGCVFENNHSTSIFWHDAKNGTITDNRCQGETSTSDPFGLVGSFVSGLAEGVTVSNNRCQSTPYTSINVSGTGVVVSGNTCISPAFSGVTISELLPAALGVSVTGNVIIGSGLAGISVFEANRVEISGNVITGNTSSANGGIRLMLTAAGNVPSNVTISGNDISANVGPGVRINGGTNINIIGNRIASNATGVFLDNDAAIAITATIKSNQIFDNTNFAIELNSAASAMQNATIDDNLIVSSNIATLQATGIVANGALSAASLGRNTFSANYDTNLIETVFANRATKALLQLSGASLGRLKLLDGINYIATATFDPPSIAAGGQATTNVSVPGASIGDFVDVGFSNSLAGLVLTGFVSAGSTATVIFHNGTAGAVDLASGTLTVRVRKV